MSIEDLNENIRNCRKCSLLETRTNALCGEGNVDAKLMLIAQAPGMREDRAGRMFIGPSGKILNELLHTAHIDRQEIYMTNLIKCILPNNKKPESDEIEICSKYLDKEIDFIDPKIIAPLGNYAIQYTFKKYSVPLPPRTTMRTVYGRVMLGGKRKILAVQHPSVLLYSKSVKQQLILYYHRMKLLLSDCKWYPVCPLKRFYEEGNLAEKYIELYCKGDWESCVRYQMEEKGEAHPDWMLPDGSIDEKLHKLHGGQT
jgi:uracil-DNA glycosylase family 4